MPNPGGGGRLGRAVFLDRDGVLNRAVVREGRPHPPASADAMEFFPGAAESLRRLKGAGFLLVVVTNQPDVATGRQRREVVEAMHRRLQAELPVDEVRTCYHVDQDGCICRKPRPGMLLQAARTLRVDLGSSYMIGDRWRDVAAGRAAGCTTVWIRSSYDERAPEAPDMIAESLDDAAVKILRKARAGQTGGGRA